MLSHYASVLTSVEGNQTFYGLPPVETFAAWRDRVPEHFRFCFKFPRDVWQTGSLTTPSAAGTTRRFLDRVATIADRVGVLSLQLPPRFHGGRFAELEAFVRSLSAGFSYAVEPRHIDWFDGDKQECRLNDLLRSLQINRTLFNTSVVHALPADSDPVRRAKGKKLRILDRFVTTGAHPFVRYGGAPEAAANKSALEPII
jgi:uncharacterized protein YecE (DUF72 family)